MKLLTMLFVLLSLPAVDQAQTKAMPGSSLSTRSCLFYSKYDPETGGYYEAPAGAGNPVAFTASRYDQSGGHQHTGGPYPLFEGTNPAITDGTGCVNEAAFIPSYAGVFNLFACNYYFGCDTLQVWGMNSAFAYGVRLMVQDSYHPYNGFLTPGSQKAFQYLKQKFAMQPGSTFLNPYNLQIGRCSNNWGGWLDGQYSGVSLFAIDSPGNQQEMHEYGNSCDIVMYTAYSPKQIGLEFSIRSAGCSWVNYGAWGHVTCGS
jgi:hypothetical protein